MEHMDGMADMGRRPMDGPSVAESKKEYYPHSFRLDKEDIAKLKLSGCEIGEMVMVHAMAKVTEVSSGQSEGSDGYESITITVQEMAVEKEGKGSFADLVYNKKS